MSEINLDAEIEELAEQIASEGAMYVQRKLMAKMPELLEESFYDRYDPWYYNRTNNLKNNSYFPYGLKTSKMYEGGIQVSSDLMDSYTTGTWSPEEVMNKAWFEGNHGGWIVTSPIPFEYITNYVHSQAFEDDVWGYINKKCLK